MERPKPTQNPGPGEGASALPHLVGRGNPAGSSLAGRKAGERTTSGFEAKVVKKFGVTYGVRRISPEEFKKLYDITKYKQGGPGIKRNNALNQGIQNNVLEPPRFEPRFARPSNTVGDKNGNNRWK
jgi:hypothetical protein